MDTAGLTQGQKIAGGAGLVLLISLWLSWYGVDLGGSVPDSVLGGAGIDTTANAWQSFDLTDLVLFITAVAAIALTALAASGRAVALPVSPAQVVAGLGALSALLVLYRIVNQPGPNEVIDVKFGAFIGLLAALGVAYGGWRAMQERGETITTPAATSAAPAATTPEAAAPSVTHPTPAEPAAPAAPEEPASPPAPEPASPPAPATPPPPAPPTQGPGAQ